MTGGPPAVAGPDPFARPARVSPAELRAAVGALLEAAGDGVAPIVQAGHPALRARAVAYDGQLDDADLTALVALMRRTMRDAPGVGLAAPQLGLPLALAVVEDPGAADEETARVREREPVAFRVLVNPAYAPVAEHRVGFYEGCLSVTGYQAVVRRWQAVHLTGTDETGRPLDEVMRGWAARIVQHETDHLLGTLYLDRAETRSLAAAAGPGAAWGLEPAPREAARVLGFEPG